MKTSPRTCRKCGSSENGFYREARSADGLRYSCKVCDKIRTRAYQAAKSPERKAADRTARWLKHGKKEQDYSIDYRLRFRAKDLVRHAKLRATRKNLPYDLDDYVDEIQARIDAGKCEVSGVPLEIVIGRTPYSPSLDRRVPKDGYVYANIRIVSYLMNVAMGTWGEDVLKEHMRAWSASS